MVVMLNTSESGSDALIVSLTGVRHVPLPALSIMHLGQLVKLMQYAIAKDGRDASLYESNCAHVEGLIQQVPFTSDILQSLRLPLERHGRRVSDTSEQADHIFHYILGVLWESVVEPIIQSLDLTVNRFYYCYIYVPISLFFTEI
jgi:hypothetical protein